MILPSTLSKLDGNNHHNSEARQSFLHPKDSFLQLIPKIQIDISSIVLITTFSSQISKESDLIHIFRIKNIIDT